MTPQKNPEIKSSSAQTTVRGDSNTHVTMACEEHGINGGPIADWMEGMKLRDHVLSEIRSSLNTFEEMSEKCREWVNLNSQWVREICVRINSELNSMSLFVHVKDRSGLTLDQRRFVSLLGLAIGARYNLRVDARIVSSKPAKISFTIEPSDDAE